MLLFLVHPDQNDTKVTLELEWASENVSKQLLSDFTWPPTDIVRAKMIVNKALIGCSLRNKTVSLLDIAHAWTEEIFFRNAKNSQHANVKLDLSDCALFEGTEEQ